MSDEAAQFLQTNSVAVLVVIVVGILGALASLAAFIPWIRNRLLHRHIPCRRCDGTGRVSAAPKPPPARKGIYINSGVFIVGSHEATCDVCGGKGLVRLD